MRIRLQRLQQPRLEWLEYRVRRLAAVVDVGSVGCVEPFLDGVSGQARPARDLTDRQVLAEIHPPYLRVHDHGNHLSFAPA